ncbi:MAG: ABC transporter substrate-binding protein [Actinomycetota bacterium]|nr:ABC transporter substrate-binding protein [Actinomycetota bacterium]
MDRNRGRPTLAAVAILALLTVAACTRDGRSGEGASGRATGPPILLGMINQENAPVGSFPEVREGAEAAVRYVNEELGGVGGRPLQLRPCTTTGSPESSRACANELVESRPVAIVGGVDLGAVSSLPTLTRAGIPYVGGSPTLGAELTSSSAFMLSGGTPADLLGHVQYIVEKLRAKKVAVLYVDLSGVLSAVAPVAREVLRKKGVTDVKLVAERADAADFTPAVTAANGSRPDAILVVFPAQGCSRIMQAKQALGVTAKMFYPSACADPGAIDAAGAGAENAYFAAGYLPYSDSSEENVAVYLSKVRPARPSLLSETGFSVVMDLSSLMKDVSGPLTPATLTAKLKETRDHPSFLGHSFGCASVPVPLLSSVCNAHVRILQQRAGRLHDVEGEWVSGAELVKLVTG